MHKPLPLPDTQKRFTAVHDREKTVAARRPESDSLRSHEGGDILPGHQLYEQIGEKFRINLFVSKQTLGLRTDIDRNLCNIFVWF